MKSKSHDNSDKALVKMSRLERKTSSGSCNSTCDDRGGFGVPTKPNDSGGKIHMMSAPWLLNKKDKKRATNSRKMKKKTEESSEHNRSEISLSIHDGHNNFCNKGTTAKNQTKRLRSALFRRGSKQSDGKATDIFASSSEPSMPTARDKESPPHHVKNDISKIEHKIGNHIDTNENTAGLREVQSHNRGDVNKSRKNQVQMEVFDSVNCNNSISPSTYSDITNSKTNGSNGRTSDSIDIINSQNSLNSSHCNKQIVLGQYDENSLCMNDEEKRMRQREITIPTPKHRNGRSPSPSSLRRKSAPPQMHKSGANYDREFKMGLEMRKDFSCVSNWGGKKNETDEYLYSRNERRAPRDASKRFSILPFSMSCLSPALPPDEFDTTEKNIRNGNQVHVARGSSNSNRSGLTKNTFCSGASSALLLDVADDDPLWKHLDGMKPPTRELSTNKDRIHAGENASRTTKSYAIDEQERLSCDKFSSHDEATRNVFQDMVIDKDTSAQRYSFPGSKYDSQENDKKNIMPSTRAYNSIDESDGESVPRYEYLMNYPNNSSYDQDDVQLSKDELLDHLRYAVQKASAQLESGKTVKGLNPNMEERYRVMTMETECSDESSYLSEHSQQKNHLSRQDFEKYSVENRRDKYDMN